MGAETTPGAGAAGPRAAQPVPATGFQHEAMFHAGEGEFLEGVLAFVGEGLELREPILIAVRSRRVRLLEQELRDSERVLFADIERVSANPARIIPAWRRFLDEHAGDGRPARGIGEAIWAGRSAAELSECERHERLVNLAFDADRPFRLLCPYDTGALAEPVIAAARASHPLLTRAGRCERNGAYSRPANAFDGELPAPDPKAHQLTFTESELAQVRAFVAEGAYAAGVGAAHGEDLVLAVNELAINSVTHGGGRGSILVWMRDNTLMCEVRDTGFIEDPLAGRTRPGPDQLAGRGLWLVNNLCDLVEIRSSRQTGTAVRVHTRVF